MPEFARFGSKWSNSIEAVNVFQEEQTANEVGDNYVLATVFRAPALYS